MKITNAEITGFKLHKSKIAYTFGQVNRISGGNGKGKTTISESITWCFYGCDHTGKTKEVFDRLKNKSSKETKVLIGVDLPQKDGTIPHYEFCRIRKGKVTTLFLNGHEVKQLDFDGLLGPMELFLSIFIPGYFGTIAVAEPTKARNMLVSMMPKLDHANVVVKLDDDDQARIEALDMVNPDYTLKSLRAEVVEIDKSLENIQGKIDYLRINSMLDVPKNVIDRDEEKLSTLKTEFSLAALAADGVKPDLHNLALLLEKKSGLRFRYDERFKEFKMLKDRPLPKAGDRCSACDHAHSEAEAKAEFESRKSRLLSLQEECEAIKQEGFRLAKEIEQKTHENEVATDFFQAERGRLMEEKQFEIEGLSTIVMDRAAKLKMAKDLTEQHEIYGDTITERDEKKADIQAVRNFMLKYVEMQVEYVNSFLHLAKVQLFKFSGSTGEMSLDFTITYGEEETEYKSLSTSEKIRCSIELAGLLNRVQNVSYPVYIDNGESIESFDEPVTQYFIASVVKKAALLSEIVA
jgi:DNA repair exonuclease SbcCD ATPase subunit